MLSFTVSLHTRTNHQAGKASSDLIQKMDNIYIRILPLLRDYFTDIYINLIYVQIFIIQNTGIEKFR